MIAYESLITLGVLSCPLRASALICVRPISDH